MGTSPPHRDGTDRLVEPYGSEPGPIGATRDGAPVALAAMTADGATDLGTRLAAIDPWARVGYSAQSFVGFLAAHEPTVARYRILLDVEPVGVMVIRRVWLHGPYLQLLGVVPEAQGRGIGEHALRWYEAQVRGQYRNLWLCVSAFNVGARRFYAAHGFTESGVLDSLVFDGKDEILMRKRLF